MSIDLTKYEGHLVFDTEAWHRLRIDAPSLLDELENTRRKVEFQRGIIDCARRQLDDALLSVGSLRADLAEALLALRGVQESRGGGKKKCGHDCDCVCAYRIANAVLAKHGDAA